MRTKDTISSKRGKNRLLKQSDKILSRSLYLCDMLYKQACEQPNNINAVKQAYDAYAELIPYIKPKLQSISVDATVDTNIDVNVVRSYIDAIGIARTEFIEATGDVIGEIPALPQPEL